MNLKELISVSFNIGILLFAGIIIGIQLEKPEIAHLKDSLNWSLKTTGYYIDAYEQCRHNAAQAMVLSNGTSNGYPVTKITYNSSKINPAYNDCIGEYKLVYNGTCTDIRGG